VESTRRAKEALTEKWGFERQLAERKKTKENLS
jgi:hypothetical protein